MICLYFHWQTDEFWFIDTAPQEKQKGRISPLITNERLKMYPTYGIYDILAIQNWSG